MAGRKNLVALEPGETLDASDVEAKAPEINDLGELSAQEAYEQDWEEDPVERGPHFAWAMPTFAVLAIAGWTAFFAWAHQTELTAGASPQDWAGWIVDWAVPVLLVIAIWLLAMRHSRREAARFTDAAQALSSESAALERRLAVVNRELSLARDFIASQSRDLESLGRVASERLSTNADRLQELIRNNGAEVDRIGEVSEAALANMDRLRDHLPVISNAARDVASQIGNAGNTAQGQIEELAAGFDRLNQAGAESEGQVDLIREKIGETLRSFEAQTADLDRFTHRRFEALHKQSEEFRVELEARETDTLAAIRRRADELARELAETGEAANAREAEALDAMHRHLAKLREEGLRTTTALRQGQSEAQDLWNRAIEQLESRMKAAVEEVARVDEAAMNSARKRLFELTEEAERMDGQIAGSADAFEADFERRRERASAREAEALAASEDRLEAFDRRISERQKEHLAHVAGLVERGEALAQRLSELDAEMSRLSSQGSEEGERLGGALANLTDKLSESRATLEESGTFLAALTDDSVRLLEIIRSSAEHSGGDLSDSIGRAEQRLATFETQANALRETIAAAEEKGGRLSRHIERVSEEGGASIELLETLEARLSALAWQSESVADQARGELRKEIAALEEAAGNALGKLHENHAKAIRQIAERIGDEGAEALEKSLREGAASALSELEQASREACESGRETAAQLRNQLAMVDDLAGNLEHRVAQARARAEEEVNSDFSRRMALIAESLNSSSIDISKAFDNEVTDAAWASYLRGDRGVFTRRAVRLLDKHEARAVAGMYEKDAEFRETVNRYIHDFESMLRSVLSTRDGSRIAVTLLSSDMGKLYVALAQAIERLRN